MRLLFVCKRRPQQRDLIERPYGRFHHLPAMLASLGHEVQVLLCSQCHLPSAQVRMAGVDWLSHDVRTLKPFGLYAKLMCHARAFRPDWVIGMSDTYFGWLAYKMARATNAQLAIDAYDNYEAYMPWNLPLHALWRRSILAADLVTAAGPQLASLLQSHRPGKRAVEIIPMAADPWFQPLDKISSRSELGFPADAKIIGYVGSWARNRGTAMLIDAFRHARARCPDLQLVLSGHPPRHVLAEPGVSCTGYVQDEQIPRLINAFDVACIITADTSFGRYSYPAKLCEAMACGVPVVATATEPVRWMLGGRTEHLVTLGDSAAFSEQMLNQLSNPRTVYGPRLEWSDHAQMFDQLLGDAAREKR